MPSKSNVAMLEKVAGSLEASNGVFVVDYRGLSVKETQEVRRALRAAGAEMKVYKNNIVKIALENAGMPNVDEMLAGTCAYVFYEKDPVDAAKVIKEQSEKLKKMEFVGAIADGKALTAGGGPRPTPTCPTASSSWRRSPVSSAASRATSPCASRRSPLASPAPSTLSPSRSRLPSSSAVRPRTPRRPPHNTRTIRARRAGSKGNQKWLSLPPRRSLTPSRR